MPEVTSADLARKVDEMMTAWSGFQDALKKENSEARQQAAEDYAKLKSTVDQMHADMQEAKLASAAPTDGAQSEYARAFSNFLRGTSTTLASRTAALDEVATASSATPADGGYLVPPELDAQIDALLMPQNPFAGLVRTATTSREVWQKNLRTVAAGAYWGNTPPPEGKTAAPKWGQVEIAIRKLTARPLFNEDLLEDAAFDLEKELAEALAEAFAGAIATAFTSGDGTQGPKGFLEYAQKPYKTGLFQEVGTVTAAGAAITYADLANVMNTLPAQYRARAKWMGSRATRAAILALTQGANGADVPLFYQPSFVPGKEDTINGFGFVENEAMPAIGASATPLAFADWSNFYQEVRRRETVIKIDPYSKKPDVEFYATRRLGGGLYKGEAGVLLKLGA